MIAQRSIITRSIEPSFAIFSINESVLGADDRSGPLLTISQGTLPLQTILWKNGKPLMCHSGISKRNGISLPQYEH